MFCWYQRNQDLIGTTKMTLYGADAVRTKSESSSEYGTVQLRSGVVIGFTIN